MNDDELRNLLKRSEGRTLDFKEKSYDLHDDRSKAAFVKDLICLANTPRETDAYIVLGVENAFGSDGLRRVKGLDKTLNFADFRNVAAALVEPVPHVEYEENLVDGKLVGIIVIRPTPGVRGPFFRRTGATANVFLKQHVEFFVEARLYWRAADGNVLADPVGQREIWAWFRGDKANEVKLTHHDKWEAFLASVEKLDYDPSRQLILFISPTLANHGTELSAIGRIPWAAVFDFDPDSEVNGTMQACRSTLELHRSIHIAKPGDRAPTHHLRMGTFWYYARGLRDVPMTMTASWREWNTRYGVALKAQLGSVAAAISPTPVLCVVLWYEVASKRYLQSATEAAQQAFGDTARFLILTDDPLEFTAITEDCQGEVISIPLKQLCGGIAHLLSTDLGLTGGLSLPSSSGAPIPVDNKALRWLEEELEFVQYNLEQREPEAVAGREFYRGSEISWLDLANRCDVDRDLTDKLRRRVREDLEGRRVSRINLYHEPGAGGTTVGRRLLWDFHKEFPCVVLRSTVPQETAGRLETIKALTSMPVLVLVDGEQGARRRQIDELYTELASRGVAAVLLLVQRRSGAQQSGERAFELRSALSTSEAYRFAEAFSREVPARREQLQQLGTRSGSHRSAFYFGLEAFGLEFKGLTSYVEARLPLVDAPQLRKIMGYLALAHHYAQLSLPAQLFADMLGLPPTKRVDVRAFITPSTLDLLVETEHGRWRPVHDLVAKELLEQLLMPPTGDRRLWTQNLSAWAKDFAFICRGNQPTPSEDMLDVVLRTFIFRENDELIGTERSAGKKFAPLIEQIPSPEGRLEVLRTLTALYPSEPHLWAHLGRFYSNQLQEHREALLCIDRALSFADHDDRLHHMRGMCLRNQVNESIEQRLSMAEVIVPARQAAESFERARGIYPDSEHAHISEVQMLIRILDYAAQQTKGELSKYMLLPSAEPFVREALQKAEDLLERVRRNREGERVSVYEEDCRAQLDRLHGRLSNALQIWNNLLDRPDVYKPPLRRQIVWTLLARQARNWEGLSAKQVEQVLTNLESNLQEDPSNSADMRLWVQAVRRAGRPPSVESIIERVTYWRNARNSLDAEYYLYVLYALKALEFSKTALASAERHLSDCRRMAAHQRNRTKSFEWIGRGDGIVRLVHQSQLGEWDFDKDFWTNRAPLARVEGRVRWIETFKGEIDLECGLKAFFNPRQRFFSGKSENQKVNFYLGFSYDGPRAWDVQPA